MEERITSRRNPLIQQVRKLASSAAERKKTGLFLGDGTKLLQEAVRFWPGLDTVILEDRVEVPELPENIRLVRVPGEIMEYISPMESPQGAVFLCRMPEKGEFVPLKGMLVLDGVQDPGNVGTILRTADALEVPVVLLEGCADPYGWKVVRSSMGAVFRTPVIQTTWAELQKRCGEAGIPIGVTALSEQAVDIRTARLGEMAIVIGSEGRGVRREILESAGRQLIIPMNPRCESLNAAVAATIVMWQMKK